MSQTEQKFDSLCTLVDSLGIMIDVNIHKDTVRIVIFSEEGFVTSRTTPDQALTEALRYLRKIKTKQ